MRTELSKKDIDDLKVFAGIIGHIGDGNFHGIILHDKSDPEERKRVEKCVHNMVERALEMDGTCTVSLLQTYHDALPHVGPLTYTPGGAWNWHRKKVVLARRAWKRCRRCNAQC